MAYIFINRANNIGGIEAFIIETANYLALKRKKVIILTYGDKSIYSEINLRKEVIVIHYKKNIRIDMATNKELRELKNYVKQYIDFNEINYIFAPYFTNLQVALWLFRNSEDSKILHIWGHPEDWKSLLNRKARSGFAQKIIKNKQYYYHRKLLRYLNESNSDFYGGKVVPVYNSWYYDIDLQYSDIQTFPIDNIDENIFKKYEFKYDSKELRVLWVGRFEYWKNEAIIHVWKTLEEIASKYDYDITYDIVGYGTEKNTKYVKDNILPKNINVNYLGKCSLEDLPKLMLGYDIGIGMGLSVKKMAQVGLPAIVIDSVDSKNLKYLKTQWLFETNMGDAGDGYYFIQAGKEIEGRISLYKLLEKIIEDTSILEEYSYRCKKYVQENYSQEKQVKSLIKAVEDSRLSVKEIEIYREPIYMRIIYLIYKYLKNFKIKNKR